MTTSLVLGYVRDAMGANAMLPVWIATPLGGALQDDPARSDAIPARTPLGRRGMPDYVAKDVTFLCSPTATILTGVTWSYRKC